MGAHQRYGITVRLDRELHQAASTIAHVVGTTLRDLIEMGLRSEVDRRLADPHLRATVEAMLAYQHALDERGEPPP